MLLWAFQIQLADISESEKWRGRSLNSLASSLSRLGRLGGKYHTFFLPLGILLFPLVLATASLKVIADIPPSCLPHQVPATRSTKSRLRSVMAMVTMAVTPSPTSTLVNPPGFQLLVVLSSLVSTGRRSPESPIRHHWVSLASP